MNGSFFVISEFIWLLPFFAIVVKNRGMETNILKHIFFDEHKLGITSKKNIIKTFDQLLIKEVEKFPKKSPN